MDASKVALMMDTRGKDNLRRGLVMAVNDNGTLTVRPDSAGEATIIAKKCCSAGAGQRVVLAVLGTEWLALAVNGGCPHDVDDIFMTGSGVDPSIRWPGTTWVLFGAGRVPICVDSSDADIDTVGKEVGTKAVALTTAQMPCHSHTQEAHTHTQEAHTHTQEAHTHTQDAHSHPVYNDYNGATITASQGEYSRTVGPRYGPWFGSGFSGWGNLVAGTQTPKIAAVTATNKLATAVNQTTTATNQNTGDGQTHENRQPSIACYIWRRTG